MPFSDLRSEFSRDAIRQRMLQHMVELWGLGSSRNVDPFPRLLLDTLASELHRVGHAYVQAEAGLLERLAGLLAPPQLSGPRPAHAVVWARPAPAEPMAYMQPADSLLVTRRVASRPHGELDTNQSIYLSAVGPVKLLDAQLTWLAAGPALYQPDPDTGAKRLAATGPALPARTLWLGLRLNPEVTSLDRLGLYVELPAPQQPLLELLPLARWHLNGQPLDVRPGLCYDPEPVAAPLPAAPPAGPALLNCASADWQLEQDVRQLYEPRFLHVRQADPTDLAAAHAAPPAELLDRFGAAVPKLGAEPLLWLRAELPAAFDEAVLAGLNVRLNAVPVLNRRLHRLLHRPRVLPNLVPLPVEPREAFLAVRALLDGQHRVFSPCPLPGTGTPPAGYYAVRRGGLERFDARDAHEQLTNLLDVLRDEAVAFAAYGQNAVQLEAQRFLERLDGLRQVVAQAGGTAGELPHYLLLGPHPESSVLEVSYWTTAGEAANGLPADTELHPYDMTYLAGYPPLLLTPTVGGAHRRDPAGQLDAYRAALLSHDRLVTSEDIRAFVQAELGPLLAEVALTPGVQVSPQPGQGFVRTLHLHLTPTAAARHQLGDAEWQELTQRLHARLRSRSAHDSQYHLTVNLA